MSKRVKKKTIKPTHQEGPLRVLMAASEAIPFIKTGGLADVVGTLPLSIAKANTDIRVIMPKYKDIDPELKASFQHVAHFHVTMGWRSQYCGIERLDYQGVPFYFIDNEYYFARESIYGDGPEEGERFAFFCLSILEALPHLDFFPDILHCHDWQTGMVPMLLQSRYLHLPAYRRIRTLFTVHNLKFQGVFDYRQIDDLLGLGARYFTPEYLEFYGGVSFMKGGLVFSNRISTVSPAYAEEIQTPYYGERLDGLLRARSNELTGILNGIDYTAWNPAADPHIGQNFSAEELEGKAVCKKLLQQEFALPENPDAIVVGMVSRLTEQKGLDLIERVLNDIMQLPIQLVVLGTGEKHFQEMLTWAQWRYQGKAAVRFELNEALAHRVYAGADLYLMPSRYEPCGLSQIIALRYGAVPIVRETGGLRDTVLPYNKYSDEGTGFSFANYNAHEMLFALEAAVKYFADSKLWARLVQRGMTMDFSWEASARRYLDLYQDLAAAPD